MKLALYQVNCNVYGFDCEFECIATHTKVIKDFAKHLKEVHQKNVTPNTLNPLLIQLCREIDYDG